METVSPDVTDREKVIALARRAGELIDEHQAAIAELSQNDARQLVISLPPV